jgi:hypothetical protein
LEQSKSFRIISICISAAVIIVPVVSWLAYLGVNGVSGTEAVSLLSRPEAGQIPQVTFSMIEQAAGAVAEYGFSILARLLTLALIIVLWRSRAEDLTALRRGLISSLIVETMKLAGGADLGFQAQGLVIAYVYGAGEAIFFGLVAYGLMKGIDSRIVNFTYKDKKCAMLGLCRQCYKYAQASCNVRLLLLFAVTATGMIASMPLMADLTSVYYKGAMFGETEVFGMAPVQQIIATRVFPLVGLVFILSSLVTLLVRREEGIGVSEKLFATGLGPIGFSLLSFITFWSFQKHLLWAEFWEEFSELLFVVAVGVVLFIFRKTLFGDTLNRRHDHLSR